MQHIKAFFSDFDQFKQFAVGWELDFNLISRNNFQAFLNLYSNETFQLGRTSLKGTIHQNGLVPKGFRSVVIPASADVSYNWLNKDVNAGQILIFPRDRTLESVSFDNFDVYVLSVCEQRLNALIEFFGFKGVERAFEGDEKYLYLDPYFRQDFSNNTEIFLKRINDTRSKLNTENHDMLDSMISSLLYKTLKYIDQSHEDTQRVNVRKRDTALKESLAYIEKNDILSIKELCKVSKVSERTLEYAFMERFQVSPSQYMKAYRLNMVKKELLRLKGRGFLLSDIAARFGFYHMGQFSVDFKRHFGVTPSKLNK